jgi:hypothetical protein
LKADETGWAGEASFTFQGKEIPATVKSVKVEGAKVVLVLEYGIEGNAGGSTLTGELAADKLAGTFATNDGGEGGTWSVTRQMRTRRS